MDALVPGRSLGLLAVPNMRDLGGYVGFDGRPVRADVVFRSGQLDHLDDTAIAAFGSLGIRSVFDLRTDAERAAGADHVPAGVRIEVLDVLADDPTAGAAQLNRAEASSQGIDFASLLGDGKAAELLEACYRGFVTLDSAHRSYRRLLTELASDDTGPAVFHCTAGKDRTGWAAAVLLLHLGVDEEAVFEDYLSSNEFARPQMQTYLDQFADNGGDPDLLAPLLRVDSSYLRASLDAVNDTYGGLDGYLRTGLGLDERVLHGLRTRLLAD